MIKLIASDVDGTILKQGETSVSDALIKKIEELYRKGILFVVASGRPYSYLKHIFETVADKIAFVANDGALIIYKNKQLHSYPMDKKKAFSNMVKTYKETECEVVLYGAYMTYAIPKSEEFLEYIRKTVRNHLTVVDCMSHVKEDYLKVGIYHKNDVQNAFSNLNSKDFSKEIWSNDVFRIAYESPQWREYTSKDANKGTGIELLKRTFGIEKDESMAFGDGLNDIEMFQQVEYSYVMQEASQMVKQYASFVTKDVLTTLNMVID